MRVFVKLMNFYIFTGLSKSFPCYTSSFSVGQRRPPTSGRLVYGLRSGDKFLIMKFANVLYPKQEQNSAPKVNETESLGEAPLDSFPPHDAMAPEALRLDKSSIGNLQLK